jgi:hypothetical protein
LLDVDPSLLVTILYTFQLYCKAFVEVAQADSSVEAYSCKAEEAFIKTVEVPPIFTCGMLESAPKKNDPVAVDDLPKKFVTVSVTKYVFTSSKLFGIVTIELVLA